MTTLINLSLGLVIGLTLGLLGGGGSILTVPALVYIVGQNPQTAVTASLLIVGANSGMGAFFHRTQGTLNWRVALVFGSVGMVTSYLLAGLSKAVSPVWLMIFFALLMLIVGSLMLRRKAANTQTHAHAINWPWTAGIGAATGALTGFLGVGGGFMILPALVMLVGLPMQEAVGTSLVVIAMNSMAGFLGHLNNLSLDPALIGAFVLAGMVGVFGGSQLAKRIKPDRLRQGFGFFVILLAGFLLYDNVQKLV